MVDLARKILLHDKLRFLITVAGVGFAVTLVFVQVGLFLGLLDNASVTIDHMDADLWVTGRNTANIDFANTFPETYVHRIRAIPGVVRADNLIVWFNQMALPTGAREGVLLYAMEDFAKWRFPWNIVEGDPSDLRRGRYIMLDESALKRYGHFQVGDYREIQFRRLKIIGRTRDAKSFTTTPIAFTDYRFVQTLYEDELGGRTTYVVVKLAPGADRAAVASEIRRRLPHNDVYTREQWSLRSRAYWVESTGLGLNMYTTVLLGLMVGVIVVAQTLYASTMEHLREFGTVKAIGGSNWDIYQIIMKQATIAAIVGYVIGVCMTAAVKPLLLKLDLRLTVPPLFWLAVFAGTIVMCLGASFLSFKKVSSLDPAMVFRS